MIYEFSVIGVQWANPSTLANNTLFRLIGNVALSAVAAVALTLWSIEMCSKGYVKDIYYAGLKIVGSYSAFLATFSLLIVLVLPQNLNWIAYMAVFAMLGIVGTCIYLDDGQQVKRSSAAHYLILCLVLFLVTFALFVPEWISYQMICLSLMMESMYHLITCVVFICEKARTRQQDNNTIHLRMSYLPV